MIIEKSKSKKPFILKFSDLISENNYITDLNGKWKFTYNPPEDFFRNSTNLDNWGSVIVPSDVSVEKHEGNSPIVARKEFAYKKIITVPKEYENKNVFIHFNACNGSSKLWIDGEYIDSNYGFFTPWSINITEYITPGQKSIITLGVENKNDELNPENKGGIIRDVFLIATDEFYVKDIDIETNLDNQYKHGNLKILLDTSIYEGSKKIRVNLSSPKGDKIVFENDEYEINDLNNNFYIEEEILNIEKWDSEHPNLYDLKIELFKDNKKTEEINKKVGFRKIEIEKNELFINGQKIKLRGITRHEATALNGRAITQELDEKDFKLFKNANINYIKTYYPPTEYFMNLCDKYGMYVQLGTFSNIDQEIRSIQNDPEFYEKMLEQLSKMVSRDKHRPSVIIWSLGTECSWGNNFKHLYNYLNTEDETRPIIFNYPMSVHDEDADLDIWSVHYADYRNDLQAKLDHMVIGHTNGSEEPPGYALGFKSGYDKPILHDEYAHIPCYNREAHKRDIGVRNFWGESIKRFWERIWETKGALGGAIMSGIDNTMIINDNLYSQEQWGIVDIYRREKPEYWHVKKAYSPIKVLKTKIDKDKLKIYIENRFNHTNMEEIDIRYEIDGKEEKVDKLSLSPHDKGMFEITNKNKEIKIYFKKDSYLIDQYVVRTSENKIELPKFSSQKPKLSETDKLIKIIGKEFEIDFSKETGLITKGEYKEETIIKSGPYLNLYGYKIGKWKFEKIETKETDENIQINILGSYGEDINVTFIILIDYEGLISTEYILNEVKIKMPKTVKIKVGLDCGGFDELGIYYLIDSKLNKLEWNKKGLWSYYPKNHIGRQYGECSMHIPNKNIGKGDWSSDETDHFLWGKYDLPVRGTNDFTATKDSIYRAAIFSEEKKEGLTILSDGSKNIRLESVPSQKAIVDDRNERISYVGKWYEITDRSGSYMDTEMCSQNTGDYMEYEFEGSGICWIGSKDMVGGMADVYIDGKLVAKDISQYIDRVEEKGMSRGYEKRYGKIIYSVNSLEDTKHTIKIVVKGKKENDSDYCFVFVDALIVLGKKYKNELKLNINSAFNYTRLAWGNYVKEPIYISDGYRDKTYIKIGEINSDIYNKGGLK